MEVPAKLAIGRENLEALIELVRVREQDKLVIVLKHQADDRVAQQIANSLETAGLRKQTFLIAIPESEGEVFVVRGEEPFASS